MSAVTAFPLLSDRTLPPAILAVRWLAQTREEGTTAISLSDLPPGNGSLPDLLRLGGITHLTLEQPPIPGAFRWEGCGGGRVVVGEADTPLDAIQLANMQRLGLAVLPLVPMMLKTIRRMHRIKCMP